MDRKGVGIIFSFAFVILLLGFVSSASCSITTSCASDNRVMELYSTTNSHGALWNGAYTNYLCCDFTGTHSCISGNTILKLSSTTNAHAQTPASVGYTEPVCFGTLSCYDTTGSCTSGDIQMVSLSASTNAHIGAFSDYSTKICCSPNLVASCGNNIMDLGETCDDGNKNPGDGCSATCQLESGYTCATPGCCQENTPGISWGLNGQFFANGGNIKEGDVLTMSFSEDFCLASGTQIIFSIYKVGNSNPLATATATISPGTPTSASYTITSGFLTALGGTSNIFFRITNPRTLDSSSISVTPIMCALTSASWNTTTTVEGSPVKLNIAGTNCNGKQITFNIQKQDIIGHTSVTTNPPDIYYGSPNTYGVWANAEYRSAGLLGDGQYHFTATVSGTTQSLESSSPLLTVTQIVLCGNGHPDPGETCTTCAQDVPCGSGTHCNAGTCVANCVLNSKYWNVSSALSGQKVQLNVSGTNCDGESVSFEIRTYPLLGIGLGNLASNNPSPSSITMTSGWATTSWFADTVSGSTSYYFIPKVSSQSVDNTAKSPRIDVTPNLYCGDGIISNPNSVGFAEQCEGLNINGKTCANLLGQGYTGNPTCNPDCTFNTAIPPCVAPPVCTINSATWSKGQVEEGQSVNLNVETSNCANGQQISFIIKENNHGELLNPDKNVQNNPSNAVVGSNVANGTWITEWMNDQGGFLSGETEPPEYYFTAKVEGSSPVKSLQSSSPDLNVTQKIDAQCSDIGYCVNYNTRASCNADTCEVGIDTAPGNVQCGGSFNSETGCYDTTDCGCSWNDISGECGPSVNQVTSCGVCGNGVRNNGEQCDDGNKVSGDGCSSTCTFEDNINKPCSLGLTLCNDNTCSLNCYSTDTGVSACNYDNVCQSNEGCTCKDCQSEQDTCASNLICDIYNTACCSSLNDGLCNPYCSYVDPDCSVGKRCGNGYRETGEQCDLGILNGVENSGCSDACILMAITDPTNGCPEGTALCTDGTCSLNCYYTDEGIKENFGTCNNVVGVCSEELTCEVIDQACCNIVPDDYCNPYCAYSDPDCVSQPLDKFAIGTCSYNETSTDTCADDNMLVRVLTAAWSWAPGNTFVANPDSASDDYWQPTGSGVFRYDPFDYSKESRKSQKCDNVEDTLVCPASVEVPFFGIYSFIGAIIVVIIVYILFSLKKGKKNSNKKRK